MAFTPGWTKDAEQQYESLKADATKALAARKEDGRSKSSKQEGLFKQVKKTIDLLFSDPRHPSLATHAYDSLKHPYDEKQKVFEAYAQNNTPGAYRVFWCYGPAKGQITIVAITPHP